MDVIQNPSLKIRDCWLENSWNFDMLVELFGENTIESIAFNIGAGRGGRMRLYGNLLQMVCSPLLVYGRSLELKVSRFRGWIGYGTNFFLRRYPSAYGRQDLNVL